MDNSILGGWAEHLSAEAALTARTNLLHAQAIMKNGVFLYPPQEQIFAALQLTAPEQCRAVVVGQDPYHGPGQANGLAFSVAPGCKLPPSLRNIFKELQDDIGCAAPSSGDLTKWARQGVLLLNTSLTVEEGRAGSCAGWGWDALTKEILQTCERLPQPISFILWGSHAQTIGADLGHHSSKLILMAPHPSPLSAYRGFFGSKPFSKTNEFLIHHGAEPIDWALA